MHAFQIFWRKSIPQIVTQFCIHMTVFQTAPATPGLFLHQPIIFSDPEDPHVLHCGLGGKPVGCRFPAQVTAVHMYSPGEQNISAHECI